MTFSICNTGPLQGRVYVSFYGPNVDHNLYAVSRNLKQHPGTTGKLDKPHHTLLVEYSEYWQCYVSSIWFYGWPARQGCAGLAFYSHLLGSCITIHCVTQFNMFPIVSSRVTPYVIVIAMLLMPHHDSGNEHPCYTICNQLYHYCLNRLLQP